MPCQGRIEHLRRQYGFWHWRSERLPSPAHNHRSQAGNDTNCAITYRESRSAQYINHSYFPGRDLALLLARQSTQVARYTCLLYQRASCWCCAFGTVKEVVGIFAGLKQRHEGQLYITRGSRHCGDVTVVLSCREDSAHKISFRYL